MIPTHTTALLIRKARAGCRRSFGRLWNEHVDGLRAVVRRLLPRHLADDVVQDVAVAALSGIGALRAAEGGCFEAWLRAIARNRARSALASQCRYRALAGGESTVENAVASDCDLLDPLQRRELHEALRRLPRCYRLPLRLRYLRGFSAPEIASRLGMTQGSVRVSLCRALSRLRGGLAQPASWDAPSRCSTG
jgi:RNA polymerase sigma-70 factor (ECF subfamily)